MESQTARQNKKKVNWQALIEIRNGLWLFLIPVTFSEFQTLFDQCSGSPPSATWRSPLSFNAEQSVTRESVTQLSEFDSQTACLQLALLADLLHRHGLAVGMATPLSTAELVAQSYCCD